MMTWKEFGRTLLWHNRHYEGAKKGGYIYIYICVCDVWCVCVCGVCVCIYIYIYVCVYIQAGAVAEI
jgi:hypothetical protein